MKKSVTVVLLVMMFFLTGCVPQYYDYEKMNKKVNTVDIVDVSIVWEEINGVSVRTETNIELIKKLNAKEMDELLLKLSKVKFIRNSPPQSPTGICLKIYYEDSYELLSQKGSELYVTKTGKIKGDRAISCQTKIFNDLLSKFMDSTD